MIRSSRPKISVNKITVLIIGSIVMTAILIIRLFQLQVIQHEYYETVATKAQLGLTALPAKRGEIIIQDLHSNEEFLLATNITLDLLFADPTLIKDPEYLATQLTPLIFNLEEERASDNERIEKQAKTIPADITEEDKDKLLKPLTDQELTDKFKKDFITKISQKTRPEILLAEKLPPDKLTQIGSLNLSGFKIVDTNVYAYPAEIIDLGSAAEKLAPIFDVAASKLQTILKGLNRYVVLKTKLSPDTSDKISAMMTKEKLKFSGIGMTEQSFRYYPEGPLAASVLGYVNNANLGQYGLESFFNTQLQGIAGKFQTKKDSVGRQITVGDSILEPAVDGDNIVLTIDRSVQLKLEEILAKATQEFRADNGQAMVMNPKTGEIIAMATYPSFNPNTYGEVFKKVETSFTPEEEKNLYPTKDPAMFYYYTNPLTLSRYPIFLQLDEQKKLHYYRYENFIGPEVYHNKIVSWPYEPGSVFKAIAMASAIDDGDVTPNTTYNDSGPVGVDMNVYTGKYDFEIKNATGYYGLVNMSTVLANSLNTGMTFVSKKMGAALYYSYLKKFGFLDRTDIEFDSESLGKMEYFDGWTESELATHAFGQGLTITMIQLANAYSAIANGGILMQPHIVKEIRHPDGTVMTVDTKEIRRVISEDTSAKVTKMLIGAVENGVAKEARVDTHYLAAKTGTAQTYKYNRVLTGLGTTITSIAGFAPVNDPKFVLVIKFDYPRSSIWCAETAAPTFQKMAAYLFDYYNIPPDR
jgi:cell division protein FtsI/penicillin-binding protein 2